MAGEQLRVIEGDERGAVVEVEGDLLLGRAATGDAVRFGDDPALSRRHAEIRRGPGGQLAIEDLGSANGTFVNDERIESPRPLVLGDRVRVGGTVFEVTDASGQLPGKTRVEEQPNAAPLAREPGEELLVTGGPAEGRRLTVDDELVVGRTVEEDGRLGDDPGLSRRHARFVRDSDRLTIEDLGSANGTFVNESRIARVGMARNLGFARRSDLGPV
jgi:pSer/pThr/pTyr-binding forkhead associated (FHA) protein